MQNNDLSNVGLHLQGVVQNNSQRIVKMSIVKLSQSAHISIATIVRTVQKTGYSGYASYRESLKLQDRSNSDFDVLNDADDKIKSVITKNKIEMNNTLYNPSYSSIEDSISVIKQVKVVYIFVRGLSESIGQEIMAKLQLTGKYVGFHTDSNIIKTASKRIKQDASVIFISLNGNIPELVDVAKSLSYHDAPIITSTTNPDGQLASLPTLTLMGYISKTNYFPGYEVRSRLLLQIMTRIFSDAYLIRAGFARQ